MICFLHPCQYGIHSSESCLETITVVRPLHPVKRQSERVENGESRMQKKKAGDAVRLCILDSHALCFSFTLGGTGGFKMGRARRRRRRVQHTLQRVGMYLHFRVLMCVE